MFPYNAITIAKDDHASTTGTLLSPVNYNRTILYGLVSCSNNGDNHITIGTGSGVNNDNNIIDADGTNMLQAPMNRLLPANNGVYYHKSNANHLCSFQITYTDYDLSLLQSATTTSTSTQLYTNGFTYGEVMIIFMLLLIFTTIFFSELKQFIFGVRIENQIKNKYNLD